MSNLFKLKEWLTLSETAQRLSETSGENVSEIDVLRFARDRHIKISVWIVNSCMARACPVIPTEQAKVVPSLDGTYNVILGYPISPSEVISLDGPLIKINGVWDLPMIRGEIYSIEAELLGLANGPEVTMADVHGVFVENSRGELFQLLCDFADTEEYSHMAKDKDIYDKTRYFEAVRLPHDSMLVVRTAAIEKFENCILNSKPANKETTAQRRERIKSYVDNAHRERRTKRSAYEELAETEGCGVENIKRIYKDANKQ